MCCGEVVVEVEAVVLLNEVRQQAVRTRARRRVRGCAGVCRTFKNFLSMLRGAANLVRSCAESVPFLIVTLIICTEFVATAAAAFLVVAAAAAEAAGDRPHGHASLLYWNLKRIPWQLLPA